MFASQLLRILQTSDVKHETCVCDSAEQDMTMNENQNETFQGSKSLGREADPLAFGIKEVYQLNGLRRYNHNSLREIKGRDECWNSNFVDDFSMDNQNVARDSTGEELQNGHFYRLSSLEDDADSLSSETNVKDKVQNSPEDECSVAGEEFMHYNANAPRDPRSACIAASDLFETDNNLYNDKSVMECELPELVVCYREINYHVVKDICMDEGMSADSKILTDTNMDGQSRHSLPRPLNDDIHYKATGVFDKEFLISDEVAATSLENLKGIISNDQGNKEKSHGILLSQGQPKSPSESSSDKDTAQDCDPKDSMQKGETNFVATSKTVTHAPEESFVDRTLPMQEFGTRSFLRSFLNSLDAEGNKVKKLPDQISSGKVFSGGPDGSSAEAGPKEDMQASRLNYNSNVETGSITFNFNSLAPVAGGITNGRTENVKEQSVDSRGVLNCKDVDVNNLSDASQVHFNSNGATSTGTIHEQSLNKDGVLGDSSASNQSPYFSSKDISNENVHDQSIDDKDKNSVNLSSNGQHQFASSKSVNSVNSDGQAVDSHVLKHEHRDPDNDSVVSLRRYDEGESSFSAAGIITYSGPIASSGSVSLRSDGSATSGRSFAFPILQTEWNSSPVRMTKPNGRHFRKHKCWRSGLLCCRF